MFSLQFVFLKDNTPAFYAAVVVSINSGVHFKELIFPYSVSILAG
jgi:hypothetical protein